MIINGEQCVAEEKLPVIDPATGQSISKISVADQYIVDQAVKSARQALQGEWSIISPKSRSQLLLKFAALVRKHLDEIAQIESVDVGKPVSQAKRDVNRTADYLQFYAGCCDKLNGESIPLEKGKTCFTKRVPVGVTAHVLPWNYPISTLARGLAPALACGCTVVAKPAEQTSLSTIFMAQLFLDAGGPDGVFNVVTGACETGAALCSHSNIDHVTFTGSTETGRKVMQAASHAIAGVTLELGGKSAILVMPGADLELAAQGISRGIFFNAGQVCTAGSRLVVHQAIHDQLVDMIKRKAESLTLGHGLSDPDIGPVVSDIQLNRIDGYVQRAIDQGGKIVTGARRAQPIGFERGSFYNPTVLIDIDPNAEIAQDEVFGPVLCVHKVDDFEQGIKVVLNSRYGLVSGIYSANINQCLQFADRVDAGQIFINGFLAGGDTVPFGGFGESGIGREKGLAALANYSTDKAVVISHG